MYMILYLEFRVRRIGIYRLMGTLKVSTKYLYCSP